MPAKKLPCGRPAPRPEASELQKPAGQWQALLKQYVSDQGLRQSDQRTKIAEVIMSLPGHFNVQEVVKKVQSRDASIGAATVYRTAALLRDAGLVRETLVNDDGSTVYEVSDSDHHDHIVCLDCGQIFEFRDERIEQAQAAINERMKFAEVRHRHVIYAHCQYRGSR